MTKEQYFHCAQFDHGHILYSMYKEKFDAQRHKPFLQFQEFMMYMQMSGMINQFFERASKYYEEKLGINRLHDETGKLIAFV